MSRGSPANLVAIATTLLLGGLVAAAPAPAAPAPEPWEATLDAALAERRYATAIDGLNRIAARHEQDVRFLSRLVSTTVEGFVVGLEFEVFAFKDLGPGETVAKLRGQPGTYQMFNLGIDQRLAAAKRAQPDSAELDMTIGRWLDAMDSNCGCTERSALVAGGKNDATYFAAAERAGLSDARSLFRIGVDLQGRNDLAGARRYYERSLALSDDGIAARYNLAGVLFVQEEFAAAKATIDRVVGKYGVPRLDSDTYQLRGLILLQLGDTAAAEKDFRRSLDLYAAHESSFRNLLYIYLQRGDRTAYETEALRYVSQDLGNTLMFNHYVNELNERGPHEFDRDVEQKLAALDPQEPKARGALYFNLARLAWMGGRMEEAEARFRIAGEALDAQKKDAPKGARAAVDGALKAIAQQKKAAKR